LPDTPGFVSKVIELHAKGPYARGGGWDVSVDADEKIMVMEWNAEHNDVNPSEATQGLCFPARLHVTRR
jgi:hypothetical protein